MRIRIDGKWPNGSIALLSDIRAFVSTDSISIDTLVVPTGSVYPIYLSIPKIAEKLHLKITATDCDTIVLDVNTLGSIPSSVTLTNQTEEPYFSYLLSIRSAYSDWETGLPGVSVTLSHNGTTLTTDESGYVRFTIPESEPIRSISIQSDQHEPLTLNFTANSNTYLVYLDPKRDSFVPLFNIEVGDVWHFTGMKSSTQMSLTTTTTSTFQWKLLSKEPDVDGSTLLTFHSTGTGTTQHGAYPSIHHIEINDTIVFRENALGWTPVGNNTFYPTSTMGGHLSNQQFYLQFLYPQFNPLTFMTVHQADGGIKSVHRRLSRLVPPGTTGVTAPNYKIDSTGIVSLQYSYHNGGNIFDANSMTRVYLTD
jgi:hypothetical protein